MAADLGLVERIGARVPSPALVAELGRDVARRLAASRLRSLAAVGGLCDLLPELASAASAASVPIALLKFAALHAGGHLVSGSRAAGDLDVLVRESDSQRAMDLLTARGFRPAVATLADHHLPPLQDRQGRIVELHTRVPGLRCPDSPRFAGFESLEAAGALERARGLAEGCYLLRREAMVAHAVVHGLAHHGGADAYPVTRMLADVIDLLPGEHRATGSRALDWIGEDEVPRTDLEAVLGLCEALEKGDLDGLEGNAPEGALLRHVLAGSLDPDYRDAMALGHVLHPLSDGPRWRRILQVVRYAVFPSDAQLAARLGLPSARMVDRRLRSTQARHLVKRLARLAAAPLSLPRRVRRRTRRF